MLISLVLESFFHLDIDGHTLESTAAIKRLWASFDNDVAASADTKPHKRHVIPKNSRVRQIDPYDGVSNIFTRNLYAVLLMQSKLVTVS